MLTETGATHAAVLVDTSVAVKWFRDHGEDEVDASRALLDRNRDLSLAVLDLTLYEVGNVITRLGLPVDRMVAVIDALESSCDVLVPTRDEVHRAAELTHEHSLTFYDASYASVARERSFVLVSADRELLAAGLAESPTELCDRLGLV